MEFKNIPVLLADNIDALDIQQNGIYVDATAGGGGHSIQILKRLTTGKLISIDQDPDAIKTVTERLSQYEGSIIRQANFTQMAEIVRELGFGGVDGVLMDIGVSSRQLDTPERGFSYHHEAPLDMRMSQAGTSAKDLVNGLSHGELAYILSAYGEEKFAGRIASAIVKKREVFPINTTLELAETVSNAVPAAARRDGHPARKTFQALRIAVNGELDCLSSALDEAFSILNANGRLAVITFHSLEDRIVKLRMNKWCQGCTCPKDFPICVCGNKPKAELVSRRPIEASEKELEDNPRSRSARLRVCKKL